MANDKPRSGAVGIVVVAAGVVVISWLGLRSMQRAEEHAQTIDAAPVATHDPNAPIVPTIPADVVADAGKQQVARIDLVLRVDGVAVSAEGAPVCRSNNHSIIGRAPGGGAPGSFDESALQGCIAATRGTLGNKVIVATVTRAGPAVPIEFVDALVAAVKRAGVEQVIVSP